MKELTRRQKEVLSLLIEGHHRRVMPTIREMGEVLGITSTNGVCDHLRALVRKGYIVRGAGRSRSIRLTEKALGGSECVQVPRRLWKRLWVMADELGDAELCAAMEAV